MAGLDNPVGVVLIGGLLSVMLFGVTITQAITYFQSTQSDDWFMVLAIIISLCLDVLHVLFVSHGTYISVVGSIGNPENITVIPWSYKALILVTTFTVAVVRLVFIRRVWYMSGKTYLVPGIQVFFTSAAFGIGICVGVRSLSLSTFQAVADTPWLIFATTGCDILSDMAITCTQCYYIYRGSAGYRGTSRLLQIIALYIIGTGSITTLWDILEVVTYASSNTLLFGLFYISLSKLYTNALLASLNARPMIQREMECDLPYLDSLTSAGRNDPCRRTDLRDMEFRPASVTLEIHTEDGGDPSSIVAVDGVVSTQYSEC